MPKPTQAAVRDRERRALALVAAGAKFDEIAQTVGYASRGSAHDAVMRAIKRESSESVAEIRAIEMERLAQFWRTFYPLARQGDAVAFDKCVKIMERRAKYLGLDFSDALDERMVSLAEAEATLLAQCIKSILDALNLTPEQQRIAPEIVKRELTVVAS